MFKCNANVFFNQQILKKYLIPNNVNYRIQTSSPTQNTLNKKKKATRLKQNKPNCKN